MRKFAAPFTSEWCFDGLIGNVADCLLHKQIKQQAENRSDNCILGIILFMCFLDKKFTTRCSPLGGVDGWARDYILVVWFMCYEYNIYRNDCMFVVRQGWSSACVCMLYWSNQSDNLVYTAIFYIVNNRPLNSHRATVRAHSDLMVSRWRPHFSRSIVSDHNRLTYVVTRQEDLIPSGMAKLSQFSV